MMQTHSHKGVSVIICCYNSAGRIGETLHALAGQQFNGNWELVLVDNASTDNTAATAQAIWEGLGAPASLRVLYEANPGLTNARKKGISEAAYSIVLFCDDDNWLCAGYVQGVFDILENDPSIAACGGKGIPVFQTAKPVWFDEYAEVFATGPQNLNIENGRLINLYGAGMAVQKNVLGQLYRSFRPWLLGRSGNQLSSAEDMELTYCFVLMGYQLYYADELSFYHYLPKERLTMDYLKKIFTAFGTDGPVRNLYYAQISGRPVHKQIRHWSMHLALAGFRLLKYSIHPPKKYGRMLYFRWSLAYIRQLFMIRKNHRSIVADIAAIKNGQASKPVKKIERYSSIHPVMPDRL